MDKGAYQPLTTAVGDGDRIPMSPSTVSFLSRLVLGLAPGLQCAPSSGGPARMVIRALPTEKSKVPVIAITANAMHGDEQRCFDAGMNDYISKPIDRARLLGKVMRWGRPAA